MTAPALPWSTCKSLARAAWTRARALAHPTREHAAEAAGVDRSHLSRWASFAIEFPTLDALRAAWAVELGAPGVDRDGAYWLLRRPS